VLPLLVLVPAVSQREQLAPIVGAVAGQSALGAGADVESVGAGVVAASACLASVDGGAVVPHAARATAAKRSGRCMGNA
jgi:hypothetical protein